MRRCLKKGNEIKLSLLPHPTHGVPVPEAPPLPPPPTPPPRPPSISIWELSPHAKLRVQVTGRHRHHYHSHLHHHLTSPPHLHTHLLHHPRVQLLSAENLHGSVARKLKGLAKPGTNWQLSVRVGAYNGGVPLAASVKSSGQGCDEACTCNPQWNEWLQTDLPVCHLPRAARACFTLYAKPEGGGKKGGDEVALGWVSMQLVDHNDQLVTGVHSLRLWPDDEANPIGCNMENVSVYGLEPPVLFVMFDGYVQPVVMQEEAAEIKGMRTMGPPPVRRARHSPVLPAAALRATASECMQFGGNYSSPTRS